jgi:hypothetical protein
MERNIAANMTRRQLFTGVIITIVYFSMIIVSFQMLLILTLLFNLSIFAYTFFS